MPEGAAAAHGAAIAARVRCFYDQPLHGHRRGAKIVRCGSDDGRAFVQLLVAA